MAETSEIPAWIALFLGLYLLPAGAQVLPSVRVDPVADHQRRLRLSRRAPVAREDPAAGSFEPVFLRRIGGSEHHRGPRRIGGRDPAPE